MLFINDLLGRRKEWNRILDLTISVRFVILSTFTGEKPHPV